MDLIVKREWEWIRHPSTLVLQDIRVLDSLLVVWNGGVTQVVRKHIVTSFYLSLLHEKHVI